jgi:hypothetical protein
MGGPVSHILTAKADSEHRDLRDLSGLRFCEPGICIEVYYHPGREASALKVLDAAYADVRALVGFPPEESP